MGTIFAICMVLFFLGLASKPREVLIGRIFWSFFAFISVMYLVA